MKWCTFWEILWESSPTEHTSELTFLFDCLLPEPTLYRSHRYVLCYCRATVLFWVCLWNHLQKTVLNNMHNFGHLQFLHDVSSLGLFGWWKATFLKTESAASLFVEDANVIISSKTSGILAMHVWPSGYMVKVWRNSNQITSTFSHGFWCFDIAGCKRETHCRRLLWKCYMLYSISAVQFLKKKLF